MLKLSNMGLMVGEETHKRNCGLVEEVYLRMEAVE